MATAVRSIPAHGVIKYSDPTREIACSATLSVQHNGDVELTCVAPDSARMMGEWGLGQVRPMPGPSSFDGFTPTGETILVTGPFLAYPRGWSASNGATALFVLTGPAQAEMRATNFEAADVEWRFGVVNFDWTGLFLCVATILK